MQWTAFQGKPGNTLSSDCHMSPPMAFSIHCSCQDYFFLLLKSSSVTESQVWFQGRDIFFFNQNLGSCCSSFRQCLTVPLWDGVCTSLCLALELTLKMLMLGERGTWSSSLQGLRNLPLATGFLLPHDKLCWRLDNTKSIIRIGQLLLSVSLTDVAAATMSIKVMSCFREKGAKTPFK